MAIRIVGLTGGIGTGKSTVAQMFRGLGAEVVDADELARQVVGPGTPALAEIARAFGQEMLTPAGTLDRARLGERVFSDQDARKRLEGIVHPRIREAACRVIAEAEARGVAVVLYEAALLVEVGLYKTMDGLIVVTVPEEIQVARASSRGGLSEAQVRSRMAAQCPTADKVAVATHVIDNAGTREQTLAQVRKVWKQLKNSGQAHA